MTASIYTVAIYLQDRRYGGPEEGGWWYDVGERCDVPLPDLGEHGTPRIFTNEREAIEWCAAVNAKIGESPLNAGRPEISSVLSIGRYAAEVHDGWPAAHYPKTKPHYE